jgi:predicted O-linked N-acetylglucosamine transferase (SPINDLY family)
MAGLEQSLIKAKGAANRGDRETARAIYRAALERYPRNLRLKQAMAQLDGGTDAQIELDAIVDAFNNGRAKEAVERGQQLVRAFPQHHAIHNLVGAASLQLGDLAAARSAFERALELAPGNPASANNLAIVLKRSGELEAAERTYRDVIAVAPDHKDARYNLANLLEETGRSEEAEAAYLGCIEIAPDYADAHYNLGNLLAKQKRRIAALAHFERAASLRPAHADTHNNMGAELAALGQPEKAVLAYESALALDPANTKALANRGKALVMLNELEAAVASFREVLTHETANSEVHLHALFQEAHMCDWRRRDEFLRLAPAGLSAIAPFADFPFCDDAARQLIRSRGHAAKVFPQVRPDVPVPSPAADGRIRIGYFSADFHNHATMYLLAGLLREHDRSRFAIHAYSYGPVREDDAMRRHVRAHTDSFTEIGALGDSEIAALARADGLDIAVDLKGFTLGSRSGMFAHRLAPVQVNYLGFPGSLGHPAFDYFVADAISAPPGYEIHFDEKLVRLAGCYQPNDDQRIIVPANDGRTDHGLPEDGFVFASFNHAYKISPREFDIWMRLLARVDGSVLWLLRSNRWAEGNLAREAAARGVDPARLVFAEPMEHNRHLGRLAHADLFLDCLAVNAHTSASDALWAGLPVLTVAGRQFPARVAASLLHAIGLPELATTSEAGYEAKALELATCADRLDDVRHRLAEGRKNGPLFRSADYARKLEAAFTTMHERRLGGLGPEHFAIG